MIFFFRVGSKEKVIDREGLPREDERTNSQIQPKRAQNSGVLYIKGKEMGEVKRWVGTVDSGGSQGKCKISKSLSSWLTPTDLGLVLELLRK